MIKYKELIDTYKNNLKDLLPIEILDIGAKGSIPRELYPISSLINITGFEPNKNEYKKLDNANNINYLPYAIGNKNSEENLYISNYPSATSLLKLNKEIVSRFWDYENLRVIGEEKINCVNLDYLLDEKKIKQPNFLKIDVEGAEYDVLEGATKIISDKSCLGIKIECRFDRWYLNSKNEPNKIFSEIDIYLRKFGFKLYDLKTYRHCRRPLNHLHILNNNGKKIPGGSTKYGQITICDGIYFKDLFLKEKVLKPNATNSNLVKSAILMDIYKQYDSVAEILLALTEKDKNFKDLINYFYLDWNLKKISYKKFQSNIDELNKKQNPIFVHRRELFFNILLSFARLAFSYFPKKIKKLFKYSS